LEKIPSVFRHFYTMLLVTLGFLIFSFTDVATGWHCFCSLVGGGGAAWFSSVALYQLLRLLPLVLIAAVGATPLPRMLFERLTARFKWGQILIPVLSAAALLLTTAYLVDSTYSPFAYTQF